MRLNASLRLLMLAIAVGAPGSAQTPIKIEPLKGSESLSGCGTSFYIKSSLEEPPQFFANDGGDARVRVNGEVHILVRKSQQETPGPKKGSSIGSRVREIWSDGQIEVTLDYKIVNLGEENEHLRGSLTVSAQGSKQTLQVEGDTGC